VKHLFLLILPVILFGAERQEILKFRQDIIEEGYRVRREAINNKRKEMQAIFVCKNELYWTLRDVLNNALKKPSSDYKKNKRMNKLLSSVRSLYNLKEADYVQVDFVSGFDDIDDAAFVYDLFKFNGDLNHLPPCAQPWSFLIRFEITSQYHKLLRSNLEEILKFFKDCENMIMQETKYMLEASLVLYYSESESKRRFPIPQISRGIAMHCNAL